MSTPPQQELRTLLLELVNETSRMAIEKYKNPMFPFDGYEGIGIEQNVAINQAQAKLEGYLSQTRTDTIREVEELVDKNMPTCTTYPDTSTQCNKCFACRVYNHDDEMSFTQGYEYKQSALHQELEQLKGNP